jgi:hypothetical protein
VPYLAWTLVNTKPSIPFSGPELLVKKRVGIVNHASHGDSDLIWFSRPRLLIGLLAAGILLLMTLAAITFFASNAKEPLAVVLVLYLPLVACCLLLIRKLSRHNQHIEMSGERLWLVQREGNTDTVLQEVSARLIHSVSSEAATASPRVSTDNQLSAPAAPFALYPSILVCAEPRNLSIKGPRRFQHQEVDFILSILNEFRRTGSRPR